MLTAIRTCMILALITVASSAYSSDIPEKTMEIQWMDNYEAAVEQATELDRPILVDFTGSDWCGWCKKLNKEVFKKQEFIDFATEEFILLRVDFPRRKPQTRVVQKRNRKLAQKYGVRGYPTILVLDSNGNALGRTGYRPGGPEKYVEHLKTFIKTEKSTNPDK